MRSLSIMSRRKQLRPFKVQDDDDDDGDSNAKRPKKNADNGVSPSSNGENAEAAHSMGEFIFISMHPKAMEFFSFFLKKN